MPSGSWAVQSTGGVKLHRKAYGAQLSAVSPTKKKQVVSLPKGASENIAVVS